MVERWVADPNEPEYDLTPFALVIGKPMPGWAFNALAREEIVPQPVPCFGQIDWAGDGLKVIKTGEFFPNGSVMMKGDLFSLSI